MRKINKTVTHTHTHTPNSINHHETGFKFNQKNAQRSQIMNNCQTKYSTTNMWQMVWKRERCFWVRILVNKISNKKFLLQFQKRTVFVTCG